MDAMVYCYKDTRPEQFIKSHQEHKQYFVFNKGIKWIIKKNV